MKKLQLNVSGDLTVKKKIKLKESLKDQFPDPPDDPPTIDTHQESLDEEYESETGRYQLTHDIKVLYPADMYSEEQAKAAFALRCARDYTYVRHYQTARFWVFEGLEKK